MRSATFLGGAFDGCKLEMTGRGLPSLLVADQNVYRLRSGRYVEFELSESLSAADEDAWRLRDSLALFASVVARRRRQRPPWRPSPLLRMLAAEKDEDRES
jgi:hypothetical protein